jgi:N6-adenosine-specific RNA methylase IME4
MKAWGFEYKSSFVWHKSGRTPIGYYNFVRHEFLLLGTRGSCLPESDKLIDSVQSIPGPGGHSSKPRESGRLSIRCIQVARGSNCSRAVRFQRIGRGGARKLIEACERAA